MAIEKNLDGILNRYKKSFIEKAYAVDNDDDDLLMQAFGITPLLKRENRQYWGRELGMCWQLLVVEACRHSPTFMPALRVGGDEPCDLRVDKFAIDTKYRLGSGDSGTLKKFKAYGPLLISLGYDPVFLFLREDNLPAAMSACESSGWKIHIGKDSFEFIKKASGFDMEDYLIRKANEFIIAR